MQESSMQHGQSLRLNRIKRRGAPKRKAYITKAKPPTSRGEPSGTLSVERLSQLFDQLPEACLLIGFDWRYLYVNELAASYAQLTKAELLGHSVLEAHPGFEKQPLYAVLARALHQRTTERVEETYYRPDGTAVWLELKIQPVDEGILIVASDLTGHQAKLAQLEQAAQELNDLYYNAPFGYHSLDQDGFFIQINDTELRWLGYQRDEIIRRRKFSDLCLPEQQARFARAFPLLKSQGWVKDLEYDMVCKDGSTLHVIVNATAIYDEQGRYVKSRSSIFDITELKRVQRALEESEARYRLLAEHVSDMIARMGPDGIRHFITPSCYALLGYRPEELIGKLAFDLIGPDDRPIFQSRLAQAIATRQAVFTTMHRLQHKAGHLVWFEITNTIIYERCEDGSSTVNEVIGVMRDISERKQAEAALAARREEELEFQGYLKALHEITIELTPIDELALFYKRVVELGLLHLGFDRLALFLYDETDGAAQGTYGTDAQGQIANEEHIRFIPSPGGILLRAFTRIERFCFDAESTLYDNHQPTGQGWNAATVLWNGRQQLGWLVVDNLLQKKPAAKPLLDILGLYGLTVATLLTQKRMQLALRESEARYRLLAETITDMVIRANSSVEFLYVSPSTRAILGYVPDELVGQSILPFIHPDDLPLATAAMTEEPPLLPLVLRFRHQQGHYIWLEATGRIMRSLVTGTIEEMIFSARDISARKSAEADLKTSEEKFRRLIETMRGGVAVYDVDDRVTYINDRACELLGATRQELLGTTPYDRVDADAAAVIKAQLAQRRQFKDSSYELTLKRKDGSSINLLLSSSALRDKNGLYSGSLVVTTDISAQKQAEDALRQALTKEKELGELKSRFVSMASHEFRTPLATVLAVTETLRIYRHKLSETQIEERFDRISQQVHRLKEVMDDVLLLAQMQARRMQCHRTALNLDGLCQSILHELVDYSGVKHRVDYLSHGGDRLVLLDQKLMRQIISNLVSNAIKYSPIDQPITVTLAVTDSTITLMVRDKGIGIPAADLPHLFEPFHRATNVGNISGTGLGLVIIREAVELHEGTIEVESQLDQGATFTVQLPLLVPTAAEPSPNGKPSS